MNSTGRSNYYKFICTQFCIKQTSLDLKGEIGANTVIVEDFNTSLTSTYRLSRPKYQQRNIGVKLYYRPNGFNRHLHNMSYNSCRIHSSLWDMGHSPGQTRC
jgi:hypothetical protein